MSRTTSTARFTARRAAGAAASVLIALSAGSLLTACGGGDDNAGGGTSQPQGTQVSLTGTAAVGAAIGGRTVTATNAAGQSVTAVTSADGSFTVSITEGAPYVLRVTDADGNDWFSYAAAAGVANITPLTTLALLDANGNQPLAALASAWSGNALSAEAVAASAARVNANLRSVMEANGLQATSFNPFTSAFTVGSAGYDRVLDAMRVNLSCTSTQCTQTIANPDGGVLVEWNANISTTGYTVSWTGSGGGGTVSVNLGSCAAPRSGTYSLLVNTSVAGFASPEICIDGLPDKPANQGEFCGATDVTSSLPQGVAITACSFDGTRGSITASISSPIAVTYTVNYEYVLAP